MPNKEDYWKNPEQYRQSSRKDYRLHKEARLKRIREYAKAHPENNSKNSVASQRKKIGFTREQWKQVLSEQAGKCSICGAVLVSGNGQDTATADHDHVLGRPRGILCKRCNILL